MGIPALLKLKHKDIGALFIFCLIGLLVGLIIPDRTWAVYTGFLVAYHFFLGWLVFMGEERAKRSLPIEATITIHLIFVILVVILVASRQSIPYFGLLPYPMAAIGIWILSGAAGDEEFVLQAAGQRGSRLAGAERQREPMKESGRQRAGARADELAVASRPAKPEPAKNTPQPAAQVEEAQPEWAKSVMQTIAAANLERAEASARAAQAEAAKSAPAAQPAMSTAQPMAADPKPQGDMAFNIAQLKASARHSEPESEVNFARQEALEIAPEREAESYAHADLPFDVSQLMAPVEMQQPARDVTVMQPHAAMSAPSLTIHEAAPEPARNGHKQATPGVVVQLMPPAKPPQSETEPYRDNAIAESIRQRPPEDLARLNPILAATAEDHEEWLRSRGKENPTHRKIGMTVREEYEQWLVARAAARAGQGPAHGQGQSHGQGQGQRHGHEKQKAKVKAG